MYSKILAIDVSVYNKDINYPLLKSNGVTTVIIKTSSGTDKTDPHARVHLSTARAAGLHIGLYHWIDPLHDGAAQAIRYKGFIDEFQPEFIAGDLEQWWADWDLWWQYNNGKLGIDDVPRVSPEQINRVTRDFYEHLSMLTAIPQVLYSSIGYMKDRGRLLKPWLHEINFWIALWVQPRKTVRCTWDDLRRYYPPSAPNLPSDLPDPVIWQWSGDRFLLPGIKGAIDLNFILKPEKILLPGDGLAQPIGFDTAYLKAGIRALNVRSQPNPNDKTNILRIILPDQIIRLEKGQTGVWQKLFGEDAWIHTGYITKQ